MRSVANPPNPWASTTIEYLDEAPPARLELFEESARSILSENDSPDIPFRWSVNPYRGCLHGCAYCYARPSHQYLGFGAGTDFERKIVVKTNAAVLLREAFERSRWVGDPITFSGNTDCYQGVEGTYKLTRACLEVCAAYKNPVAIITRGTLIRRDIDVLQELVRTARVGVYISIAFSDDGDARRLEPFASPPSRRFETIAALHAAGIPVGVALAPIIPGLNDHAVPEILTRAREAGACAAFTSLLRLPRELNEVFHTRLAEEFPARARRVLHQLDDCRSGQQAPANFGERMRGAGPRWDVIRMLFETTCKRLGMRSGERSFSGATTFRRPSAQQELF